MRRGQTFALIHLIELLMAMLVVAFAAIGLIALVSSIGYYEQFYAKDNAYVLESLHAVPNGDVQFGYLWASPNYVIKIDPGLVTVNKVTTSYGGLVHGASVKKAYGTDKATTITPATIQPQYLRYSSILLPKRVITATAQLVSTACPATTPLAGVQVGDYGDANTNSVGQQIAKAAVTQAQAAVPTLDSNGIQIFIVFEPASEASITAYDRAQTALSTGIICALQSQGTTSVRVTQDALSNAPSNVQSANGDIILLVRGLPGDEQNIESAISLGIVTYVKRAQQATQASATSAPTGAVQP